MQHNCNLNAIAFFQVFIYIYYICFKKKRINKNEKKEEEEG
jgi:hypothetical protein